MTQKNYTQEKTTGHVVSSFLLETQRQKHETSFSFFKKENEHIKREQLLKSRREHTIRR